MRSASTRLHTQCHKQACRCVARTVHAAGLDSDTTTVRLWMNFPYNVLVFILARPNLLERRRNSFSFHRDQSTTFSGFCSIQSVQTLHRLAKRRMFLGENHGFAKHGLQNTVHTYCTELLCCVAMMICEAATLTNRIEWRARAAEFLSVSWILYYPRVDDLLACSC